MAYDPRNRRTVLATPGPQTAQVVRSDDTGVWAAPLDGDTRHPIGPCRGASHGLPVGTVVLLIDTDQGPWVARTEND